MLDREGQELRDGLLTVFARGIDHPLPHDEFNRLALAVFAYQFRTNKPYAAYCARRSATPASVTHWTAIPAVPTAAFKEIPLVCGNPSDAEVVFRTSGTTAGAEKRGEHYVLDLSLYRASLLPSFAAHLLPSGECLPILSLIPPAREAPDSSLSFMVADVMTRLGGEGSDYFASARTGLDVAKLDHALRSAESSGTPVCLLGTSFAFVHWLDLLRGDGASYRLPEGSRLMDTGGFKGRSREVAEEELRGSYAELLGITEDYVVNEYGMTEMCSQFYDDQLRARVLDAARVTRAKAPPPWVRTVVVDADRLQPVREGDTGLLRHYDLANLGSVMAIQTEDVGRIVGGDRFVVLGRATGAPPRGCSVAMDLLLSSLGDR